MSVILGSLWKSASENPLVVIISVLVVLGIGIFLYLFEKKVTGKVKIEKLPKSRYMAIVSLLSAMAGVLMLFDFPLPFLAPGFYKMDLSEIPALVGAFMLGPVAGLVIESIKILIHLFVKGTTSAFVGELANFTIGAAFILPTSIIYYLKRTRKTAVIGMIAGTIFTTVTGVLLNAFVLLPFYAVAFGMDKILDAGRAVNPNITDVFTFCIFAVAPFNLFKFTSVSFIVFFLYRSLSRIIRGAKR